MILFQQIAGHSGYTYNIFRHKLHKSSCIVKSLHNHFCNTALEYKFELKLNKNCIYSWSDLVSLTLQPFQSFCSKSLFILHNKQTSAKTFLQFAQPCPEPEIHSPWLFQCVLSPQATAFQSCRTRSRHSSVSTGQTCLLIISKCSQTGVRGEHHFLLLLLHRTGVNVAQWSKVRQQRTQRSIYGGDICQGVTSKGQHGGGAPFPLVKYPSCRV